jgi:hypothetical protein
VSSKQIDLTPLMGLEICSRPDMGGKSIPTRCNGDRFPIDVRPGMDFPDDPVITDHYLSPEVMPIINLRTRGTGRPTERRLLQ